jgi:hypothetical protein
MNKEITNKLRENNFTFNGKEFSKSGVIIPLIDVQTERLSVEKIEELIKVANSQLPANQSKKQQNHGEKEYNQKTLDSIEQLVSMLDAQLIKVKQSDDKVLMKKAYETVLQAFNARSDFESKKKWFILEEIKYKYEQLFLEELGGREEGEIDGYSVSYKLPNPTFRLDQKKVREQFSELSDEEYKNMVYSYTDPKKKLTIK